jgi:endonuclease I
MQKRLLYFLTGSIILTLSLHLKAQIPSGYYDGTAQLNGEALKAALHTIIKNHQPHTYSQLWQDFIVTDQKPNGKVWDMYSDVPGGTPAYEYTFVSDQCGNYSGEGSCYNREHSWPASWFDDQPPMYTDLFHIVPTDGYVNNRRGNFPFGEVGQASWTSTNGSRVGGSITAGYGGTVFEPIDAYKGDLARGLMYMSARYYQEDSNWPGSDMTLGADLKLWARALLLQWHEQDPVSDKEIARNNAIYQIQLNRNPFIDHPEFAGLIWDPTASISDNEITSFKLWPNPANQSVSIEFFSNTSASQRILYVTDMTGKLILTQALNEGETSHTLSVDPLAPGFYFVSLNAQGYHVSTVKLIKK